MEDRNLSTSDLAATESTDDTTTGPETPASDTAPSRERGEHVADDVQLAAPGGGKAHTKTANPPNQETPASAEADNESLLPPDQSERFSGRWQEIQTGFVDEPRRSVEQADALVADLMQRLATGFAEERQRLEAQWDRGDDISTEDLRVALTRYRSFFDRLLSA